MSNLKSLTDEQIEYAIKDIKEALTCAVDLGSIDGLTKYTKQLDAYQKERYARWMAIHDQGYETKTAWRKAA